MSEAWFHSIGGAAGDMVLASLIDAGADAQAIVEILGGLNLSGWTLETSSVTRGGLAATAVHIEVDDDETARPYGTIVAMLDAASLPDRVLERSHAVFARLARAESAAHQVPIEHVHFHEVGGHDALIDIVGTAAALEVLGIDTIRSAPLLAGTGTITAAHGTLPNPAPATIAVARGFPMIGVDIAQELTTPTGAAILATLCTPGPLGAVSVTAAGYGAGSRELPDRPNVIQVVIGDPTGGEPSGEHIIEISTNVDDATGEQVGFAITSLLAAGAQDAWATPIVMKKGRPALCVSVLARMHEARMLAQLLMELTGTFGVRLANLEKQSLPRTTTVVTVGGHDITIKVGPHRRKVEFDDLATAAGATGRSIDEVRHAALRAHDEFCD